MKCQWFLKCENEATILVPHSVLKEVPSCDKCAEQSGYNPNELPKVPKDYEYNGYDRLTNYIHNKSIN